ncbi:hypothetical protein Goshw_001017 [Gossypium schwendimanii]|uniref:Uncharacterized protein n=1 Tax=Gossypium schwendimanii TaxID=34291 RepID=A0A7J9L053_GOSSC|nr:hypothetical protein [Gossypium schwendimanii]
MPFKISQFGLICKKRHHLWMKKTIFTIQVMVLNNRLNRRR